MAVGAYATYNFMVRIDGMPLLAALLLGGLSATAVGVLFGIPSLRIKGLYLAVATLAAQFFIDWAFLRIPYFTNNSSSGSVSVASLAVVRLRASTRRCASTCSAWPSSSSSRCSPRTSCAATSAASGWRSATWTSPPR